MPVPVEHAAAAHTPEGSGLEEAGVFPPSGPPPRGSASGWSGHVGAGTGTAPDRGTGQTATGGGKGPPGADGGNEIRERVIGTDEGPLLVKMTPPVYPRYARRMGREGRVVLSVLIDESGRLVEARVIEEAGHGFDEAAMEAVRLSIFKPAVEDGIPVACRARLAVRFQLRDTM